jgi:GGDEF domain-containing protein
VDALYLAADTALYQAKDAGRNCVMAFKTPLYSS